MARAFRGLTRRARKAIARACVCLCVCVCVTVCVCVCVMARTFKFPSGLTPRART